VLFGPEGLGFVQPSSIESVLPVIVSLAIGLILFEGGLTLDLRGYSAGSQAITRLLTVGVVVTWLGAAFCAWLVFDLDPALALLAGSLVIVTGPTVIGPLLKRIRVEARVHNILHWEGVLIDAIGVFIALLCFEWVAGRGKDHRRAA
jgi:NhaP-type Na+/H+ or K+/H+ antiporter